MAFVVFAMMPVVALVAAAVTWRYGRMGVRTREAWRKATLGTLFLVVAVVLVVTLLPSTGIGEVRLVPFSELGRAEADSTVPGTAVNLIGNIVLFVPLGFLCLLALGRGGRVGTVAVAGFALSLTIEVTQLLVIQSRTSSTTDVILNVAGAVIGATLARSILWVARPRSRDQRRLSSSSP